MNVIVANCYYEGNKIMVPFLLENFTDEKIGFQKGFIWQGQIDTGFDGFLMMPFRNVQQNGLQLMPSFGNWQLADVRYVPY